MVKVEAVPSTFIFLIKKAERCGRLLNVRYLWDIQNMEQRKISIEKQLKGTPELKDLKILKEEIEKGQSGIRKVKAEQSLVKKELKEKEDYLTILKDKLEKADAELYSGEVTSSKELESMQKNLAVLKGKIGHTEETALTLMEKIENNEDEIRQLTKELEKKKTEFRSLNKNYQQKKEDLARSLTEIQTQKELLMKKIAPEILQSYYKLCEKFDDKKGVALLQNGICSGCHMSVSFDLRKQAKTKLEGVTCDNCSRLLLCE